MRREGFVWLASNRRASFINRTKYNWNSPEKRRNRPGYWKGRQHDKPVTKL